MQSIQNGKPAMNKICLTILLLLLINTSVFSQETGRKLTLQTSPAFFLTNLIYYGNYKLNQTPEFFIIDLEVQYKISNCINVSLTSSFCVLNFGSKNIGFRETISEMLFKPMFIYRPFKTGIKGFYLGLNPIIGWHSYSNWIVHDYGLNKEIINATIGFGLSTGYKWVFKNGFTLQLGIGSGKIWQINPYSSDHYDFSIYADGSLKPGNGYLLLDIKLGYSF